jgi:hypothetical protein
MRTILFIFSIAIFTSCNVYRYTGVESKNIQKNEQSIFAEENDTLRIEYNFSGTDGPVSIKIFNKTNEPLYVDWKRSSFIANDKAVSYFNPGLRIDGTINSQAIQLSNQVSNGQAVIGADIQAQPGNSFIPPHSYTQNTFIYLTSFANLRIPVEQMKKEKLQIGEVKRNIWKVNFSETNSPLVFKSYVTFMLGDTKEKYFFMQHGFYIASSAKTSLNPDVFYKDKNPGDNFYTKNLTGLGTFIGIAGIAGGITLAAIAAPDNTQKE